MNDDKIIKIIKLKLLANEHITHVGLHNGPTYLPFINMMGDLHVFECMLLYKGILACVSITVSMKLANMKHINKCYELEMARLESNYIKYKRRPDIKLQEKRAYDVND